MSRVKFNGWLGIVGFGFLSVVNAALLFHTPSMYSAGHVDAAMATGQMCGVCGGVFLLAFGLSLRAALTGRPPLN